MTFMALAQGKLSCPDCKYCKADFKRALERAGNEELIKSGMFSLTIFPDKSWMKARHWSSLKAFPSFKTSLTYWLIPAHAAIACKNYQSHERSEKSRKVFTLECVGAWLLNFSITTLYVFWHLPLTVACVKSWVKAEAKASSKLFCSSRITSTIFSKNRKQTLDSVGSAISEMKVINPCLTTCLGTKALVKENVKKTIVIKSVFIFNSLFSESVFNGLELQWE